MKQWDNIENKDESAGIRKTLFDFFMAIKGLWIFFLGTIET